MKSNNWTPEELKEALLTNSKINFPISNISINSELVKKGELFIPIKGKRYDGHQFISHALSKGANYSLATGSNYKKFKLNKFKKKIILVKNIKDSLNNLAMYSRKRIKGKILGITGSLGKTSIKEAIYFILKKRIDIQKNDGNFNNLIGMPISLAKFQKNIDFGILELGMNRKGEIKKLSNICMPDIALITKISNAHIGNFNNLKDIVLAKSEIFSGMNNSGIAILNDTDTYLSLLKESAKLSGIKQFIFFGKSKKSDISLLKVEYQKNNKFKVYVNVSGKKINFLLNNLGTHWIENSLAIISVLFAMGQDIQLFSEKIKYFQAIKGRGKLLKATFDKKKFEIIDDSYNSSPESLSSSMSFLHRYGVTRRKICVLGDMYELGKFSRKFHLSLKKDIKDNKIFKVYTIGKQMKNLYDTLPLVVKGEHSKDLEELFAKLKELIKSNDVILFKGSRSMKLDEVIDKFK